MMNANGDCGPFTICSSSDSLKTQSLSCTEQLDVSRNEGTALRFSSAPRQRRRKLERIGGFERE
jgi:hypothetical protein